MPGVFVAGDVRHGSTKRVAAAVGEGATAVAQIELDFDLVFPASYELHPINRGAAGMRRSYEFGDVPVPGSPALLVVPRDAPEGVAVFHRAAEIAQPDAVGRKAVAWPDGERFCVDAECRLVWRSDRLVDDELEFVATDGDTIHARGFDRGAMREFAIDAGTGERLTTA